MSGRIKLILGPMFAGKTERLIRTYKKYKSNDTVKAIKPAIDTRHGPNSIVSHNLTSIPATSLVHAMDVFSVTGPLVRAICIDEGQFFPDLVECCLTLSDNGIDVFVAALNGTSSQTPWPVISNLMAHVDSLHFQNGVCYKCKHPFARYTFRTTPAADLILIGGDEAYVTICCFCLKDAQK